MVKVAEQHVFVLDDESAVCEVIARVLRGIGVRTSCYVDPAMCLVGLRSQTCNLLITDLKLPEMDGIEVLQKVKQIAPFVPVLVMSAYGDIPTAVRAMKAGAVDFIEKPLEKKKLIFMVEKILHENACTDPNSGKPLSIAETNVLALVLGGKTSKEIGKLLHRSTRTIEWHRSHIMHKLKAGNMLDLIKRVVELELIDVTTKPDLARATKTLETACTRASNCPVYETMCTD